MSGGNKSQPEKEYLALRQTPRKSFAGMEITGHTIPQSRWLEDYSNARFRKNYPKELIVAPDFEVGYMEQIRFISSIPYVKCLDGFDLKVVDSSYVVFLHSDAAPIPLKPYTTEADLVLADRGF